MTSSVPKSTPNDALPYSQHHITPITIPFGEVKNSNITFRNTKEVICGTSDTRRLNVYDNNLLNLKLFTSGPFGKPRPEVKVNFNDVDTSKYFLINLIDKAGKSGSVTFNRLRVYLYGITPANGDLRVGIYKLGPTATFGDTTTYTDSSLVVESDPFPLLIVTDDNKFIDIPLANTTLKTFDGINENKYFLAIKATQSIELYSLSDTNDSNGPPYSINGYIYTSNIINVGAFDPTMYTTSVSNSAPMLYFLLWENI